MKTFAMIRFHALGPWILACVCVELADLFLPPMIAISTLHVVLQLASFRWLSARRAGTLTLVLMIATVVPGVARMFYNFGAHLSSEVVAPDLSIAPVRIWIIVALGVAMLFHADLQRVRIRRLRLRKQLQRRVRRRSAQVRRSNDALRREVARRQATQHRLTRTETHLQSLSERMQLQVLRKDIDGVITYANDAFCRGVGRTVNDVIGSTDADLYPTETAEKYRNDDELVMSTGAPVDHVESHPTADGVPAWVQVFKAPEYDEKNVCTGIQMVFWDVTETYRRTAELRRSEARKRALFDAAREAVMLVDDLGCIVEANPAAEALFGNGRDSLAGHLLNSIAVPDSVISTSTDDGDIQESNTTSRTNSHSLVPSLPIRWQDLPTSERRELVVRRRDHSVFPAEVSVHPIPLENSQGLAVFVRDVTLRHRAVRALREAKRVAEDASRTKSEFMAGVSHEIRTPLGGITGSADLLARMDLPPRANQYVAMIRQSGDLLSGVIGDILDFASIEAGRLQIDPAPTDLHLCIGEAFRCLATRAAGKDIELILSISPDVPRHVLADAKRLRQIVINLAGNAIKFTHHGHVWLRLTATSVSTRSKASFADMHTKSLTNPSPRITIEMIDTGIGIAKEMQAKIFQPFEQGDSGTTRRYGGTGLGLSITDQLVKQMGGSIEVISRPGHGSTFRCHLPLPMIADPSPPPRRQPKSRALAIDLDIANPIQRNAITDLLVSRGFRIDRRATLRIVDLSKFKTTQGSTRTTSRSKVPRGERVIWLANVDDPAPTLDQRPQVILLKPIIPDDLLSAIEQLSSAQAAKEMMSPETTPEVVPEVAPEVAAPITVARKRQERLLVVDDSEVNRTVIRDFLSLAGIESDVVDCGAAAIMASKKNRYDCVLMDLQMPEMDGIETMQQITRQCELRNVVAPPVIALTAHATNEHQTRCLAAGMKSFLVKPIDPKKLIQEIDKVLGHNGDVNAKYHQIAEQEVAPPSGDWQAKMLACAGGDQETCHALAEAFVVEVPQLCEALRSSIHAGDIKRAYRAAHTLKSCLKYLAPDADWQFVYEIEKAAAANDVATAKTLTPQAIDIAQKWTERVVAFIAAD